MYKKVKDAFNVETKIILRLNDNASIPPDPANTDYANFKREIEAGTAEVQDANGNVLSVADAKAYVRTLP